MAKYKNRKKKTTSVKEVDVIEENIDEEELEEELEEEVEEVEEIEEVEDDEEEEEYDDDYEEIPLEERLANIEKKTNVTFWLVIAILVVVSLNMLFTLNGNSNNEDAGTATESTQNTNSQTSSGYDTSAFNTITPDKIKSLSDGKTIIVWLGYQGCGYCQQYAPIIAQVAKDFGITANYINVQTLTEEGLNTIHSLTGSGEWKEFASTFKGTPFTLIIKNNKVVGGIKGAVDASTITKSFESAGLKK